MSKDNDFSHSITITKRFIIAHFQGTRWTREQVCPTEGPEYFGCLRIRPSCVGVTSANERQVEKNKSWSEAISKGRGGGWHCKCITVHGDMWQFLSCPLSRDFFPRIKYILSRRSMILGIMFRGILTLQ